MFKHWLKFYGYADWNNSQSIKFVDESPLTGIGSVYGMGDEDYPLAGGQIFFLNLLFIFILTPKDLFYEITESLNDKGLRKQFTAQLNLMNTQDHHRFKETRDKWSYAYNKVLALNEKKLQNNGFYIINKEV